MITIQKNKNKEVVLQTGEMFAGSQIDDIAYIPTICTLTIDADLPTSEVYKLKQFGRGFPYTLAVAPGDSSYVYTMIVTNAEIHVTDQGYVSLVFEVD